MRRLLVGACAVAIAAMGFVSGPAKAAPSSGYDNWACRPSARHPRPVVLIHGLGGNGPGNWAFVGPRLADAEYCAFELTYGKVEGNNPFNGMAPVAESGAEIGRFIDKVLARTGATKVDLVGHSEGGFQSIYIPKVIGYGPKVGRVVAIAPPTHGTTFLGLVKVGYLLGGGAYMNAMLHGSDCHACADLIIGGPGVAQLTNGPIAVPGVAYTVIASRTDLLVTPHETSFIREPGVRNFYVQDLCPLDPVGHVGLVFDTGVVDMVLNGLDPAAHRPVRCRFGLPV